MKRRINPFFVLYELFIFFPIFFIITALTAITTITMSALFGDTKWGYYPGRWWAKITCAIALVKVKIVGNELIDNTQSYIFVANHQSTFDIFLIYGWLDNKFKWIMKNEVAKMPMIGRACKAAGHIFIDRTNARAALRSIEAAAKRLVDGMSVVIFPEGTRTRNGEIQRFRKGAFQLASNLDLPIVPVTIKGAYEALPRDSYIIRPGKISMIFHEPIDTQNYNHDNIHELIQQTHEIIKQDL